MQQKEERFFQKLRSHAECLLLKYPLVVGGWFLFLGLQPGLAGPLWKLSAWTVLAGCGFLCACLLPVAGKHWKFCLAFLMLGMLAGGWWNYRRNGHYRQLIHTPNGATHALVRLQVLDSRLISGELGKSLNPRRRILVRISRMYDAERSVWEKVRGYALWNNPPSVIEYGSRWEVEGALIPLERCRSTSLNWQRYVRLSELRGISHQLESVEARSMKPSFSPWRYVRFNLFRFRDLLLSNLLTGIKDRQARSFLIGIMFGLRSASYEQMQHFRYAGTVHLFAVSGLHVGIVSGLFALLALVTGIPSRWKYGLMPWLTLVYVLMVGESASAWRAFVMITFFCLSRFLRRYNNFLNILGGAAAIILFFSPIEWLSAGFQYTFILVTAISLAGPILETISAGLDWKAPTGKVTGYTPWWKEVLLKLANYIGVVWVFWLGGWGLTAYYSNLFLPYAWLVNLFLLPLMTVVMGLAVTHMLLGLVGIHLLGPLLEGVSSIPPLMCEWVATAGLWHFVRDYPFWIYGLYYLFFFSGLIAVGKRWRFSAIISFITMTMLMLWVTISPVWIREGVEVTVVLAPGHDLPGISIWKPGIGGYVINPGDFAQGRVMVQWLRKHSAQPFPDAIIVPGRSRNFMEGIRCFTDQNGALQSRVLVWQSRGSVMKLPGSFQTNLTFVKANAGTAFSWLGGNIVFHPLNRGRRQETFNLDFFPGRPDHLSIQWKRSEGGFVTITLLGPAKQCKLELWNSNGLQVWNWSSSIAE